MTTSREQIVAELRGAYDSYERGLRESTGASLARALELAESLADVEAERDELRACLAAERGDPAGALPDWESAPWVEQSEDDGEARGDAVQHGNVVLWERYDDDPATVCFAGRDLDAWKEAWWTVCRRHPQTRRISAVRAKGIAATVRDAMRAADAAVLAVKTTDNQPQSGEGGE